MTIAGVEFFGDKTALNENGWVLMSMSFFVQSSCSTYVHACRMIQLAVFVTVRNKRIINSEKCCLTEDFLRNLQGNMQRQSARET